VTHWKGLWRGCALLGSGVALTSGIARANGRYPAASQLVVDPETPSHIVARATFGILDSADDGKSWTWVCEDAIGYFGVEDPAIAVTADGSTLVASSKGVRVSHDGGCSWSQASGSSGGTFGVDLAIDPSHPHTALALEALVESGVYRAVLRKTSDDGATWAPYGAAMAPDVFVATVEIAPSDPDRVYVSGRVSATQESVLERSRDGGATWQRLPLPLPAAASAYIGAVDPHDSDVIYVRVRSSANSIGRVLVSRDAGTSWTPIWSGAGEVAGFALSEDGATLAVGGPESGIHVASTADMTFERVSGVGVSCLAWSGPTLLACAKEVVDGFSVGRSQDRGATFSPLLLFADVAPRACTAGSTAGTCGASWPAVAVTIGADAGPTPADADSDAAEAHADTAIAGGGCSAHPAPSCGVARWAWLAVFSLAAARSRWVNRRRPARRA
jgi:photosystem II stability/assembly factor-like uncharacterized protein